MACHKCDTDNLTKKLPTTCIFIHFDTGVTKSPMAGYIPLYFSNSSSPIMTYRTVTHFAQKKLFTGKNMRTKFKRNVPRMR